MTFPRALDPAARPRVLPARLARGRLALLLRGGLSLTLIAFLVSRVDLGLVARTVRDAHLALLVLSFGLYLGAIALGTLKWQVLCRAQGLPAGFGQLLNYTFVSLFFGNFLPSNVGSDVVRAVDLARASQRAEAASISVLVDRVIGLLVFMGAAVLMSLAAVIVLRNRPEIVTIALAASALFLVGFLAFAALLSRRVSRRAAFVFRLLPQLNPLHATARRVYQALQVYRRARRALLWAAAISLAIQLVTTVVNYLLGLALGLPVPFIYYFLFNPLVAFVLLLPISLNGIGLKETAYVTFYATLVGLATPEQALSLSLLMHVLIVLSSLIGGVLWLPRRRASPG